MRRLGRALLGTMAVILPILLNSGWATARMIPPQDSRPALPELPGLGVIPGRPAVGPASGALEPSAFATPEGGSIGGRLRGGSGRIPRKLVKTGTQPAGMNLPQGPAAMTLPRSVLDDRPDPLPAESSVAGGTAALADDEGPANGLTLDAAIGRMLQANLDLLALKYEIPQAEADILTAGLFANPLIYSDAQLIPYGRYTATRPVGPTEYDIIITQPLDLSHKRKSRVKVARAAKSALEAQFQDVVRRQIGSVYKAFVDLQTARLGVLAAEAALRERGAMLAQERRHPKPGDDLSKLETAIDKAQDGLSDARDSFDDAREAIALLMNMPPAEIPSLQPRGGLRDQAPPAPPLDELTALALAIRPDLVAARRGTCRAESEVTLAKANRFDDVFLFYDPFSYQDNRISRQPSGRSWAIGLTVPLPLFNRNQGNIARARSNVDQTNVELIALERRVTSEVRLAEREYRNSKQALARVEQSTLPKARAARISAAADFATGTMKLDDYNDRIDDDNDAVKTYRDALIRHRRSMLDLNTAVGQRILP